MRRDAGFTLIESLVALVLLTLGVLALAGTGWRMSDLLERHARGDRVAEFARRRVELLRATACSAEQRTSGTETLRRGGATLATSFWSFESSGGATLIRVITSSTPRAGASRLDTIETAVLCAAQ